MTEEALRKYISAGIDFAENLEIAAQHYKTTLATIEYVESISKLESSPDLAKLTWNPATGPKGNFEKSAKADDPVYAETIEYLKRHGNFCVIGSHKVWLMPDGTTVARRLRT